jgi:hypothetical protein
MKNILVTLMLFPLLLVTGCATTTVSKYQAVGKPTICNGKDLGSITVLPETAWRSDQKEPEIRSKMALEEITKSFQRIPCGNLPEYGGVKEFSNWSSRSESELLTQFSAEDVDTLIIIRIEELTPRLSITFSLPFLWASTNEADFRIRVISVETGAILNDMRIKQVTGGPFNVRPAEWSRAEISSALDKLIDGPN